MLERLRDIATTHRAMAFGLALTIMLIWSWCHNSHAADKAGQAPPAAATEAATVQELALTGVSLGTFPEYSRIIFQFSKPVDSYEVIRVDVDELMMDLMKATYDRQGRFELADDMVTGMALGQETGHLVARIKTRPSSFTFRHFTNADRTTIAVDLRPAVGELRRESGNSPAPAPEELSLPPLENIAGQMRTQLPETPQPNTDEALQVEALDRLSQGDFQGGIQSLESLEAKFPGSLLREQTLYLLGDAYFHLNPDNPTEQFVKITETYQTALGLFPDSPLVPRGKFILALAYLKMNFINEAASFFRSVSKEFPGNRYDYLSQIYLGEIYLKLGKRQLAKAAYDSILAADPKGRLFLESYFELGKSFFPDGLFSQANEIFKEILKRDDLFYLDHPDILYYLGEGYFNLNRMDLARAYLYHVINLKPDIETADTIMARIGDTYKEQKLDDDAIKIFVLTRDRYPDSPGALISQMRLADYGALRALFPSDTIFMELENGVQEAILKIYKKILETKGESPLLQLAMFKVGGIYSNQENYDEAIKVYKEILEKYPKGTLTEECRGMAEKAILAQVPLLFKLSRYADLIDFVKNNDTLITVTSRPEINHYLGMAYSALNRPQEAVQMLSGNQDYKHQADQRLLVLGQNYLKLGQYEQAVTTLEEFRRLYHDHTQIPESYLDQARMEATLGRDDLALQHLEQALSLAPSLGANQNIQDLLGQLYLKKGDFKSSVIALEKSLDYLKNNQGSPDDIFNAYYRLGQAYASLGSKDQALAALDAALAALPESPRPEALYLMAKVYRDLGNQEKVQIVLDALVRSTDPFWRQVAEQEMAAMKPDDKITRLLEKANSTPQ
jgi:tetratricopeptide (TPR) repeat protein